MDNIIVALIAAAGTIVVTLITALFANRKSLKAEVSRQMELLLQEYKDERDKLKEEVLSLRQEIAALQETKDERDKLKEEVSRLRQEMNDLQEAYNCLISKFEKETEVVESLRSQIRALEIERDTLLAKLRGTDPNK